MQELALILLPNKSKASQPTNQSINQQEQNSNNSFELKQVKKNCSKFLKRIYTSMMKHTSYPSYHPIAVAGPKEFDTILTQLGPFQNQSSKFRKDDEVGGRCKAKLFSPLSKTIS
jgi:hypothetical protein